MKVLITNAHTPLGSYLARILSPHVYYTGIPELHADCVYLGADPSILESHIIYQCHKLFIIPGDEPACDLAALIEHAAMLGKRNIVLASSADIYAESPLPSNEFSRLDPSSNRQLLELEGFAAQIALAYPETNIVILRFSTLFPDRQDPITKIRQQILNRQPVYTEHTRDYITLPEAAVSMLLAADAEQTDCFNIGSGRLTSDTEILYLWNKILKTKKRAKRKLPTNFPRQLDVSRAKRGLEFSQLFPLELVMNWAHDEYL